MGQHIFKSIEISNQLSVPNGSFFHGRLTSNQAITADTITVIQLTSYVDTLDEWDAGNYRFVVRDTGLYYVFVQGCWIGTNNNVYYRIYSTGDALTYDVDAGPAVYWPLAQHIIRPYTAGDFIYMNARVYTVGDSLWGDVDSTFMIIKRMS